MTIKFDFFTFQLIFTSNYSSSSFTLHNVYSIINYHISTDHLAIFSIIFYFFSKRICSIEFYFIQCICENLLRCFSIYLQIFARITTIEIVNHMHEHINRKHYPLLRHHPWLFPISINSIDAKLITKGLSIFFRQAN